jgi:hypothetical protein
MSPLNDEQAGNIISMTLLWVPSDVMGPEDHALQFFVIGGSSISGYDAHISTVQKVVGIIYDAQYY